MTDFETHPVGTAARIAELEAALTRANAATAAAFEVAARAINDRGAVEQENFGLKRAAQNFFRARDIVRALATPGQTAALDRLIAEAMKPFVEALTFYRDGWSFKTNKRYHGLEWFPKEELLDDCGNKAATILAASKRGGA